MFPSRPTAHCRTRLTVDAACLYDVDPRVLSQVQCRCAIGGGHHSGSQGLRPWRTDCMCLCCHADMRLSMSTQLSFTFNRVALPFHEFADILAANMSTRAVAFVSPSLRPCHTTEPYVSTGTMWCIYIGSA